MAYIDVLIENCRDNITRLDAELKLLPHYPEMRGQIIEKYVTCNRAGCACHNGYPHGPNKYYRYCENGVWKEKYLGKKILDDYMVRAQANEEYNHVFQLLKEQRAELSELLRKRGRR